MTRVCRTEGSSQPKVFSNSRVQYASWRKSAEQSQAAREGACRIPEVRARRARRLEHHVGHDTWMVGSGHHLVQRFGQGCANLAILIERGIGLQEVGIKL